MAQILTLAPAPGTFPFAPKRIPLPPGARVTLGAEQRELAADPALTPRPTNGWFPADPPAAPAAAAGPLPVSARHAEVWLQDGTVFVRDLDSAFGTFVNGVRSARAQLDTGDVLSLGAAIPRNKGTPAWITDAQLQPIVAKITLQAV